jgi:hypothetical protein
MHSLTRQRASIVFSHYIATNGEVFSPKEVSKMETILADGRKLISKDNYTSRILIGVSVPTFLRLRASAKNTTAGNVIFETPGYLISITTRGRRKIISICLKYSREYQVQTALTAWYHAVWLAKLNRDLPKGYERDFETEVNFQQVSKALLIAGWDLEEDAFVYESETRWSELSTLADDKKG